MIDAVDSASGNIFHPPVKRSITIAGHQTSVSLEPFYWDLLKDAAVRLALPVNALVAQIDVMRLDAAQPPGLATAIRLWLTHDMLGKSSNSD